MINWQHQDQEIKDISDFPDDSYGFVYKITHIPTGKAYIGKKILYFTRKVKLGKKDLIKESDWKSYWGSNKELLELVKTEPEENWEKWIIKVCPTKKLLTYYETKYLFIYQALEKPDEFWNDNILGKFYTKDFD